MTVVVTKEEKKLSIKLKTSQIYLTLLRESNEHFYLSEQLCQPLFSLEINRSFLGVTKNSDVNLISIDFGMLLELYYFNLKRNFYEPLIESTNVTVFYENSTSTQKKIHINIPDILNINFPVALYDTVFSCMNTLGEELDIYNRAKGVSKNEIQKSMSASNRYDIDFNPSLYFIKNSTGETLMFKTSGEVKYSELMPEESSELLFEVMKDLKNDAHLGELDTRIKDEGSEEGDDGDETGESDEDE